MFNIRSKVENEADNIETLDKFLNNNGFGEAEILTTIDTTIEDANLIE